MVNELLSQFTGNMFPRTFGTPYRCNSFKEYFITQSVEELEEFIKLNNETNCYCSVYSYTEYTQTNRNKMSAVIDVIPFDFDSDDLQLAFNDLKVILSWCKRHNIEPRIYFSSNKGFHLYIDIEPITLKYPQQVLAKFGRKIKKAANVDTLDSVLFGDLERIIRIPNTKHGKSGRYCIPLNNSLVPFLTIDDIIKMSEHKSDYVPIRYPVAGELHEELYDYDNTVEVEIEEMKCKIAKIKEKEKNVLFPTLNTGIACPAYHECMDSTTGVPHHSYNFYLAGCVCKLKSDGLTKDATLKKVLELGSKCDPPMDESNIRYVVDYQWSKSWSFCTFFSKVSEQCDCCINRRF